MRSQPLAKTKVSKTAPTSLDYPACPASLDTLEVSVPPAVKLQPHFCAQPTLDPDTIAVGNVEDFQDALAQFAVGKEIPAEEAQQKKAEKKDCDVRINHRERE